MHMHKQRIMRDGAEHQTPSDQSLPGYNTSNIGGSKSERRTDA